MSNETVCSKMISLTVAENFCLMRPKVGSKTGETVLRFPGDTVYVEEAEALFLIESGAVKSYCVDGRESIHVG